MSHPVATPPHNLEAEEAVIGAVLIDPEMFRELDVQPDDFYLTRHKWIWSAFAHLTRTAAPIDLLTVQEELNRRGQLAETGGPAYLTRLITLTPTAYNAPAYAGLVAEASARRRLIAHATTIAKLAYDSGTSLELVQQAALDSAIANLRLTGGAVPLKQVMGDYYDRVTRAAESPAPSAGLPTGFADYDKATGGLHRKRLVMLSGEPGRGKSLLAVQIALQLARAGHPGAVYELEMPNEELAGRAVSPQANITTDVLETGRLSDSDWPAFTQTITVLSQLPVWVSDATHWTTASLRADLVRLKARHGITWFIVDYLRLLRDQYGSEDHQREGFISKALKSICKDLDLAGLVIHSMTKAGLSASLPGMEHLSGSGQISFDADAIVFITEHIPAWNDSFQKNLRTLTWAKLRNGDIPAPIHLVKRPGFPAFGDYAREPVAPKPEAPARRRQVEPSLPYKD